MIFLVDLGGKAYLTRFKSLLKEVYKRLNCISAVLNYLLYSQFLKAFINCIINPVLDMLV